MFYLYLQLPMMVTYNMTKAAIMQFTKCAALGKPHMCVNTCNHGPPIVLLFIFQLCWSYLHWFCTPSPTVDLLTIVDPIGLYCHRSMV